MDMHFNTTTNHNHYWADWTTLSFVQLKQENPEKKQVEVLEMLLDRLQLVQRALGQGYQGEIPLRTAVVRACRGVPEFELAIMQQKPTCEGLFSDLRGAIQVAQDRKITARQFAHEAAPEINFVDRRYRAPFKDRQRISYGKGRPVNYQGQATIPYRAGSSSRQPFRSRTFKNKRCFVCKKEGCWSTNHPEAERKRTRDQYLQACQVMGAEVPPP
jgi:hypothetical protein